MLLPKNTVIPHHIAIIPDGNRRWAKERGLAPFQGHEKGADTLRVMLRAARSLGIHTLTVWVFSTENWTRSDREVTPLMKLFEYFIDKHVKELIKEGVRFICLGRKDRLNKSLLKKLMETEEKTKNLTKHVLNIAVDYGGHDEIIRATKRIIKDVQKGLLNPDDLTKEVGKYEGKYPMLAYTNYLDTKDQPYPFPDLLIRTSGEQRTSGLMPWQAVYAELYFEKCLFPDFTPEKLKKAIIEFSKRNRRFGGS